jgi:hypothetical protein
MSEVLKSSMITIPTEQLDALRTENDRLREQVAGLERRCDLLRESRDFWQQAANQYGPWGGGALPAPTPPEE